MKPLSEGPFRTWFGFTRRERRSSLVLLLIIFAVTGVRYLFPDRESELTVIPLNYSITGFDTINKENTSPGGSANVAGVTMVKKLKRKIIDLNTCDSASLVTLPGIGPVLSARILKYRKLLGGFASVNQLREVYGLPPETVDLISEMVRADSSELKKININRAEYRQLIRMPYLEKSEVAAILKYREEKGRFGNINDLIENELIAADKGERILPYLEFN